MFRRIILVACSLFFLSAAPASAQSYGDTLSEGEARVETVAIETTTFEFFEFFVFDELARTGSDNMVPLVQAGIVLLGGGSLLVIVAKRRRSDRRNSAA